MKQLSLSNIFRSDYTSGFLLMLIAITLPWPIRFSSQALVLFCAYSLLRIPEEFRLNKKALIICSACWTYFILHLLWWIFQQNFSFDCWKEVEKKLALLFLPPAILNARLMINDVIFKRIWIAYIVSLSVFCICSLIVAIIKVNATNSVDYFFYHNLANPLKNHAVYLSAQIITALYILFMKFKYELNKYIFFMVTILFSLMLILLASKLMIAIFLFSALLFIVVNKQLTRQTKSTIIGIIVFTSLAIVLTPQIRKRYLEIIPGKLFNSSLTYSPSDYFDGLSLRQVQMKLGIKIISQTNNWLIGIGPFDAQKTLDEAYKAVGMYAGEDGKSGYLGLNFHNQYMETFVRFGIVGFVLLLSSLFLLIHHAFKQRKHLLLFFIFFIMAFFLTESVLETQRGIILFLFTVLVLFKSPNLYSKNYV